MATIKNKYNGQIICQGFGSVSDVMPIAIKKGISFRGADLESATLRYVNLEGADLENANLRYASMECACLKNVNLKNANLRGSSLRGACLEKTNLEGTNLRGAYLEYANLEGANLEGVYLEDASLKNTQILTKGDQAMNLFGSVNTTVNQYEIKLAAPVVDCCEQMVRQLEEGGLLEIVGNTPFTQRRIPPTVYILSDDGHGGFAPIKYCPFCGAEIKIK